MSEPGAVVHVVVAGEIGGAERMLVDLARANDARPHTIALFTPNMRLRDLFADAGIALDDRGPVVEGTLPYLARTLGRSDAAWLTDVLVRRRARIVHLHTFQSQVVGTRAALRIDAHVIRTEHSTRVYDDPSCWPFSRWSLQRASASVCISDHVRKVAVRRAPWAARIFSVVPNGVDVAHFTPRPRPPRGPRLRLVMSGRLDRRKGVDLALQAIAEVPSVELELVGDGDERASLERLVRSLRLEDRVRFTGFAPDVRDAIARSDLALSTARSEGLGIALLEAMAMERAVVALPTGGVPEIVRDGETGLLASDPKVLVRVLRELSHDRSLVEILGTKARAHVLDRYSVDAMREGYERHYSALGVSSATA